MSAFFSSIKNLFSHKTSRDPATIENKKLQRLHNLYTLDYEISKERENEQASRLPYFKFSGLFNMHGMSPLHQLIENTTLVQKIPTPSSYSPLSNERLIESRSDTPTEETSTLQNSRKNLKISPFYLKYLNSQTDNGLTPLMLAIKLGNFETFEALLKYTNCNLTLEDKNGNTALHYAMMYKESDPSGKILTSLTIRLKEIDLFKKQSKLMNKKGHTPKFFLNSADKEKDFDFSPNKDLNKILKFKDSHMAGGGQTPLMHAIQEGNLEAVELLIDHDCDLSLQDDHGNIALHYAAFYKHKDPTKGRILKALVAKLDKFDVLERNCFLEQNAAPSTVYFFGKINTFEKFDVFGIGDLFDEIDIYDRHKILESHLNFDNHDQFSAKHFMQHDCSRYKDISVITLRDLIFNT